MALWHLLVFVCFALPIGCSLASAQHANGSPGGYVLAMVIGLVVGGGCAWVMWVTHKTAVAVIQQQSPSRQAWSFPVLYLAKILWIVLAGFLGFWLPSTLLWLVFGAK